MAKKAATKKPAAAAAASDSGTTSSPVRNTPIPKVIAAVPARKVATREQIAYRAYEISISGTGSDELGNWLRAERELNGV